MDPLTMIMMQRAMAQGQPPQAGMGALQGQRAGGSMAVPPAIQPPPPQPPPGGAPGLGGLSQPSQMAGQTGMQSNPAPQVPSTPQASAQPPQVPPPSPTPAVPPSGGQTNTPPQAQRFANAQAMMQAYRNGWQPNPMLIQAAQR